MTKCIPVDKELEEDATVKTENLVSDNWVNFLNVL